NKAAPPTTRTITVCKYVVDNGTTPNDEGGTFGGTIDASTGTDPSWSSTATEGAAADCHDYSIAAGATFKLDEGTKPGGWTNSTDNGGYPKYVTGAASCATTAPALDPSHSFGTDVSKVTICNKSATRTI